MKILKVMFVVSLVVLTIVTIITIDYTKNMYNHKNFGDWLVNAGYILFAAFVFAGTSCGLNYKKGFMIHGFWLFFLPIIYTLVYTWYYIKYSGDFLGIIGMPLVFLALCGLSAICVWIDDALNTKFNRKRRN